MKRLMIVILFIILSISVYSQDRGHNISAEFRTVTKIHTMDLGDHLDPWIGGALKLEYIFANGLAAHAQIAMSEYPITHINVLITPYPLQIESRRVYVFEYYVTFGGKYYLAGSNKLSGFSPYIGAEIELGMKSKSSFGGTSRKGAGLLTPLAGFLCPLSDHLAMTLELKYGIMFGTSEFLYKDTDASFAAIHLGFRYTL